MRGRERVLVLSLWAKTKKRPRPVRALWRRSPDYSPLLADIALSVLDEHLMEPWKPGGAMSTAWQRQSRRSRKQLPNWRVVRYADDFVVLVNGSREDVLAVREDVSQVLKPLGLGLSQEKTQVTHLEDGIDFLGFHIQWRRKKGTDQWHVYTFIAKRPIRQLKAKIRALTRRQSQQDLKSLLVRINLIVRGWSAYFRHAVAKNQFSALADFIWWRVMRMLRARHDWTWKDIRRRFVTPSGRWRPISAEGTELFDMAAVAVTRYRWRGARIPSPWTEIRA